MHLASRSVAFAISTTVPHMTIRVRAPQGQFLLERILAGEEGITVEVRGFDLEVLRALAQRVASDIRPLDGVTDVSVSREAGVPQQAIQVDRQKVADLGLSVRDVTEVIETAVAGSRAGEYRVQGNAYRILVQLEDAERRSLDEIRDLTLRTCVDGLPATRSPRGARDDFASVRYRRRSAQWGLSCLFATPHRV